MKITHTRNRNELLAKDLPSTGDQLDAIWNLLINLSPQMKAAVEADPVFQSIQSIKTSRYPKNPTPRKAVKRG